MSRLGYIFFILLLIGYPHFGLTAQTQLESPKEGTSTVSGRVTLKGEPAQGITVVLRSPRMVYSRDLDSVPWAKTDENGRFRITKVAAGAYFVRAVAPGLVAGRQLERRRGDYLDNKNCENRALQSQVLAVLNIRVSVLILLAGVDRDWVESLPPRGE
jgi:Carboxypeptidase regulatory-like domain